MSSYLVIMKFLVALPSFLLTALSLLTIALRDAFSLVLANLSELPTIINEEIIQEVVDYYRIDSPVKDVALSEEELQEESIYGYSA